MIILDTDICISLLYGKIETNSPFFSNENVIAVTSITAEEIFYAANKSSDPVKNRILVEKFLLTVRILHMDLAIMKDIANIQTLLNRRDKKQTYADIVIYCMAKSYGAQLITRNSKRYCFT